MNSKKFCLLISFFLLLSLSNAFALYLVEMENVSITTIVNPFGGPDGESYPPSTNAYYWKGPAPGNGEFSETATLEQSDTNPEWIEFRFTLRNLSTSASGGERALGAIDSFTISLSHLADAYAPGFDFVFIPQIGDGSSSAIIYRGNLVIAYAGIGIQYDNTITYALQFPLNDIQNDTGFFDIKVIPTSIVCDGGNACAGGIPRTTSIMDSDIGHYPTIYTHDPNYVPPPPLPHDLDVYLDVITCADSTGAPIPGVLGTGHRGAPVDPIYDPIRCDLVDSNTIYYELRFVDINAQHVDGSQLKINAFNFGCYTTSLPDPTNSSRVMHHQLGYVGGYADIGQYVNYPPTCNFLHYASPQPGHTACLTSPANTFPEYSLPPAYTEIPVCNPVTDPSCESGQDKNVYYNTNAFMYRKYLNPDEFTLQYMQSKVFTGTITNAATGGNVVCHPRVSDGFNGLYLNYTLYDSLGNEIATRGWEGANFIVDFYKSLKLDGHDAFVVKNGGFMNSSLYVRPLLPWTIEIPIRNNGIPWDGTTPKDVLYIDVNIATSAWEVMGKTITIPSADYPALGTDESRLLFVDFPISEGLYHQFLTATAAYAKLYDRNQWIFDFTDESSIQNLRLITILAPEVYEILGDSCFTDPNWDILCWWNYLPYRLSPVDLNANSDIDFILRQRNPFDVNEFFDLTHYTNAPTNARLEFNPQRNFVPSFTSGTFGYRYSVMTLKNPRWIRSDTNYQVVTTSVNYPYVWDDLKVEFKNFSHNLKIESFTVSPQRDQYSLGEELDFRLDINNTGNIAERDINFLVVSSMDPSIRFYAPAGLDWPGGVNIINPGQIITFVGTLPAIPSKNVFVIEATVNSVPFEATTADNSEKIVITTEYSGNVSALPETNYFFIAFILFFVLFVVIKK